MWLRYGVSLDNCLVSIDEVGRGSTNLACPYCGGPLIAKKGYKKEYHFAHASETCKETSGDRQLPQLPAYDKFNLCLSSNQVHELNQLWAKYNDGLIRCSVDDELVKLNFIKYIRFKDAYQFDKLGKLVVGALSLDLFNQVQEPLILQRLQEFEKQATKHYEQYQQAGIYLQDLNIYRAEYKKILSQSLYFLEVTCDGQVHYKIGVSTRVGERLAQIKRDLCLHFKEVDIKILGEWNHRGNVEKYFKFKYADYQGKIGTLTEYFRFSADEVKRVLRDLRRMKTKVLTPEENSILAGESSSIEKKILADELRREKSGAIKLGMSRAKYWGQHVGRPRGASEDVDKFLSKPTSIRVRELHQAGLSLRAISKDVHVSVNTVRKVIRYLQ